MLTPDKGLFALRCTLQNLLGCEQKTADVVRKINEKLDKVNRGEAQCVPEFHYVEYGDFMTIRLQLTNYSEVLMELRKNGWFYEQAEATTI